ncbi:MAG: excinuclease ABC subunit UvrA [bacterium]|nr:excinuclease ABC subunit UvrA [bacterium]
MQGSILIRGARVHNLKNITVSIPRGKLVVLTGLSGSGKSSLAFDTLYAEGQRRYVESLSAYARQFLGLMDKPDVDSIEGLSPAISIDQKSATRNPRSTVGTVTEIYDYLRLLFARTGVPHCPQCGRPVKRQTVQEITDQILALSDGTNLLILAPKVRDRKGEAKQVFKEIEQQGYVRVRVDGTVYELEEAAALPLDKQKRHSIEVVVDRLLLEKAHVDRPRVADSVETAARIGEGTVVVEDRTGNRDLVFSERFACPTCGVSLPELEPRLFSFNSPHGACPACTGLGTQLDVDPSLVLPNPELSINEGAIKPWAKRMGGSGWASALLEAVARRHRFSLSLPVRKLSADARKILLTGTGDETYTVRTEDGDLFPSAYEGVVPNLLRRYKETDSDYARSEIERFMVAKPCPTCQGKRLKPEALAVRVAGRIVPDVVGETVTEAQRWFTTLAASSTGADAFGAREQKIAKPIVREILARLQFLQNVGLDYLTLDRPAATLSGGEAQRIRLATQIGSGLTGVLYILDEPSIGLHQRDNARLITTLRALRDLQNTVIVVEHDEETIRSADWVVDIGPGAGEHGGEVTFEGSPAKLESAATLTGKYLSGRLRVDPPARTRVGNGKALVIRGATEHNLKNLDVRIPLGLFVCVTGVSGSGKSTLVNDILARALAKAFHDAKEPPGAHERIEGLQALDKVVLVDQSPIGRTPRSNTATYTGLFTPIRELFAATPEARARGYDAGRFSFNVRGGRCDACQGDGVIRIEMQFLPDVYVECEECHGKRYNREALEITVKGVTIAEVLDMTVERAHEFFRAIPAIESKLKILEEVGLGYVHLGQPATQLSGGEAQRIKLATELSRRATGRTLYLLDEPTTGLHFDDVRRLLVVLQALADKGNSVLVIEHNLEVIKCADWVVDLGPEGGNLGGEIVAEGTPREVAKTKKSYTGQYLAHYFEREKSRRALAKSTITKASSTRERASVREPQR